jgi:hypothetical protein
MMGDWFDEKTDDPTHADRLNYYKVEKWLRHGARRLLTLFPVRPR